MTSPPPLGPFPELPGYTEATRLDTGDGLAAFRSRFFAPDPEIIYLDGNSLGRLPRATIDHVTRVMIEEWGTDLITSWNDGWWELPRRMGDQIAPLIGAPPGSVVLADSTSVCLYKLALGAIRQRPERTRIVTDSLNFPTDGYVLEAVAAIAGGLELVTVPGGVCADEDAIIAALDETTALLSLSHVSFKSGYLYDMDRLTNAAHAVGALVLWDLSHSAGVVAMDLSDVDLAVGCTYKYLNGGPGAPAFLYVNPELTIENPLTGWWGHAHPFTFAERYLPAQGISRFQTGTMPILSLAAIGPAVRLIAEAGIGAIRDKSVALTGFLVDLADRILSPVGFEVASPRASSRRGSHVSLRHPRGWQVTQAMISEAKLYPDFREPDNIRLGLAPLYTSFMDVHTAVGRIRAVTRDDLLDRYPEERDQVT